jgi:hypothetical protein
MYSTISNLGKSVDYHTDQANPLTYCLYPNYNAQWIHGSTTTNLLNTPQCEPCQIYMSERCSNNFDEFCQIYYENNRDTFWPNLAGIDVQSQKKAQAFLKYSPTTGDNMIRNSVEKKLFIYPSVINQKQPFDPNMASSPMITKYTSNTFAPSWTLHPEMMTQIHDDNEHVNLMLSYPYPCFDLLARFHQIYQQNPTGFMTLAGNKSNNNLTSFLQQNNQMFTAFQNY